jgi:hypothetical protein
MRRWFSETRRTDIDTAIHALRPKAAPPVPVKRWEIRGVLASPCDGVGAQSLFALAKQGRRFALGEVTHMVTGYLAHERWLRPGHAIILTRPTRVINLMRPGVWSQQSAGSSWLRLFSVTMILALAAPLRGPRYLRLALSHHQDTPNIGGRLLAFSKFTQPPYPVRAGRAPLI